MSKKPLFAGWPVWALILALIGVVGGTALFICAATGVFGGGKTTLSPEYYAATSDIENSDGAFLELLTPEKYQELTDAHKSFLIFVDQTNCINADRMREFITSYAAETGVKPYRLMFSNLRNTNLKGEVKYYPSTVIIKDGTPATWLNADSDADASAYNDYAAYQTWLNNHLQLLDQ